LPAFIGIKKKQVSASFFIPITVGFFAQSILYK